ncbi:MAG: heparinase, partial [Planctomycetota bacterium]|nr:heparinase [Planctomycetota bacterium]
MFAIAIVSDPAFAAREHGGRYTAQRLANARANCNKHEWAAKLRDAAVKRAAPWLARSDAELWAMVPGQDLPRCIDVTMDRKVKTGPKRLACLKCGEKINAHGNYPYEPDFNGNPWKLTCPSCQVVFPTNDFAKYYASAIDERGLFNPAKGDTSLLFNAEHPDPNDPLHKFGVDDGFGYVDENGRAHKFIGYYTWKYWRHLFGGVTSLADAYVYTGDSKYAHKTAVLLDRIADVYPSMDWKPYAERGWFHSDGDTTLGKIEGRIWECGQMTLLVDAYEKILPGTKDAPDLYAFLKSQAEQYKLPTAKGTRDLLIQHIDDHVLREVVAGIHAGKIIGNEGMHQRTMATCAVALDTAPESDQWLDWVFAPNGGALPGLIVGSLDRDGISPEAGPGYALMWGSGFAEVASLIADYPRYTEQNLYRDFPHFRATFTAAYRICALGVATPNIGDSGATGSVGRAAVDPNYIADGFRYTREPAMAIAAYRANG